MARTLIQLVQKVAETLDRRHFISGTVDPSGNEVGALTSADFGKYNDNQLMGKWLYFTSGTTSTDSAVIYDYVKATTKAHYRPDLSTAPDNEPFLMLPYQKSDIEGAIADAVYTLHDTGDLVREILMYGVVGGSPIYNSGFDYWTSSSTPDGWSRNGSSTLAKTSAGANTFSSRQSLSVSGAADYVKQDEPWKSWLEDFKGGSVRFYCPVVANNASHARIAIYDGETVHYSNYHSGNGAREILDTDTITISSTATDLEIRLYNDGTNPVYFGDMWIEGSQVTVREIPIPVDYISEIMSVETLGNVQPTDTTVGRYRHIGRGEQSYSFNVMRHTDFESTTRYGVLSFNGVNVPANGTRLLIRGTGQLSVPASDSAVIEVDRTEELMLAYLASAILLEDKAGDASTQAADKERERAAVLRSRVGALVDGIGQKRIAPVMERSM